MQKGVDTVAQWFGADNRRQIEQAERCFAEEILGNRYEARIYSISDNTAKGTVMLSGTDGTNVHNAYVICTGKKIGQTVTGTAVGVLVGRTDGSVSVVISCDTDDATEVMQYQIAEAVDYWEADNSPKIYCLREKSCGAVVYTGDGADRKYLIIRMNLGHCGLPKGHIEKYETERETAVREVLEETGVAITLDPVFRKSVVYSLTQRTSKESVYFLGRFEGCDVKIQESEVSSYRLCSYEEARRCITYENDRLILDEAEQKLSAAEKAR